VTEKRGWFTRACFGVTAVCATVSAWMAGGPLLAAAGVLLGGALILLGLKQQEARRRALAQTEDEAPDLAARDRAQARSTGRERGAKS
jgi:hypothetical protein